MSQDTARVWLRRLVPVVIGLAVVFAVVRSGDDHVMTWIAAVAVLAAIGAYLGLFFWTSIALLRSDSERLRDRDPK
jgi:predicted exporter